MQFAFASLGFPLWLRTEHWINVFFIGMLARAGVQILASYPRLYWNESSLPGTEWLKFTKRTIPRDRLWTSLQEEQDASPWIAQPGGDNLGLGRHWHFFSAIFWALNGVVYVALLFITGEWQRLIPTSWSIFPAAWQTFVTYITFHLPPQSEFHPYDPLQQLTYAAVVFLLGPFLLLTGAAQSPALEARFPWYVNLWGGRQSARSLHFLGLVAVVLFTIVHTLMVIVTGFGRNISDITLGADQPSIRTAGIFIGIGIILLIVLLYAVTAWATRKRPRQAQNILGAFFRPLLALLTDQVRSRQQYKPSDISPFFIVNGNPPDSPEYLALLWGDFLDYTLEVKGLVERPLCLSLDQLKALPITRQITKHNCVQGWSAIGEWGGVALSQVLALCHPKPAARFIVFRSYSRDTKGKQFYEVVPIQVAQHPQTILAYEMNWQPLPLAHGAPLRLRVETMLGFKMTKWIQSIEFVEEYAQIGEGQGGSREDNRYNEIYASA